MTAAERNELLAAIDECAAQARHLADAYDLPALVVAAEAERAIPAPVLEAAIKAAGDTSAYSLLVWHGGVLPLLLLLRRRVPIDVSGSGLTPSTPATSTARPRGGALAGRA